MSEWKAKPSRTQIGTIGERFIGSRIESSRPPSAVVYTRLAKMAICDIEDENTRYNTGRMVLCGIVEGVAKLKEKIDDG